MILASNFRLLGKHFLEKKKEACCRTRLFEEYVSADLVINGFVIKQSLTPTLMLAISFSLSAKPCNLHASTEDSLHNVLADCWVAYQKPCGDLISILFAK